MNFTEPDFRFGSTEAIEKIALDLNLKINKDDIQDWSYIVANPIDFSKYLSLYDKILNDDEKFVLMEILIQSVEDQNTKSDFNNCWIDLKERITSDFSIHKYTIYYWCVFDNENLEDCWKITSNMRELWKLKNTKLHE